MNEYIISNINNYNNDNVEELVDEDMGVYQFMCKKCKWKQTATMKGAAKKCPECGSAQYLEKALIMDSIGRKIKHKRFVKYSPLVNQSISSENELTEKVNLPIKKKVIETMELKKWNVTCTNQHRCKTPAFETEDKSIPLLQNCRACGFPNKFEEI